MHICNFIPAFNITRNGLKLVALLLQPSKCWDCGGTPPHPPSFAVDYQKDCVKVQGIRPHQLNHHEGRGREGEAERMILNAVWTCSLDSPDSLT